MRALRLVICLLVVTSTVGCSSEILAPELEVTTRQSHPDEVTLTRFAEGELSAARRVDVSNHLATCDGCNEYVALHAGGDSNRKYRR